jgi:membrane protease YdiL (CAAX protease family)
MTRVAATTRPRGESGELAHCLLLVLSVWCVVLSGRVAQEATGDSMWTVVSLALAAVLVSASRPRHPLPGRRVPLVLGFFSGFVSYPGWVVLVWLAGSALGLPAGTPTSGRAPWLFWLALVLFAPVFEELLYREHVQSLARKHLGGAASVAVSSVLFAISHVQEWSVLNALLAGVLLGSVRLASGSVLLCIALHAGFNLATLACGLPPERFSLSPPWSSLLAWAALLGALGLSHSRGRLRRVRRAEAL